MKQLTKGSILQNQQSSGQSSQNTQSNGQLQKVNPNQQQDQLNQQQLNNQSKYQDMKRIEDYMFCLSDLVGKGASGKVYLGENTVTKELVAIKVIDLHQVKDEYTWGLICSEIDIMKKLQCENVVKLIDVFQTTNNAYIVTELCEDGDLVEYMKKNLGKIRQNQAVKIISDILKGLQELAKQGIIHRDLKPANILISKKDIFKITDFGFARMVEKTDYLMTSLVGTPLYMSPQILKRQMYTSKCDVWSIGLMFYELIYGQTPWPSNSVIDLVNNMFQNPLNFPTNGQAGEVVLEGVKEFIRGCLKFEETDRLGWEEVYKHALFKDALSVQKNSANQNGNTEEKGSQLKQSFHQKDQQNKKGSFSSSFQTSFMTSYTTSGSSNQNKTANQKGNSYSSLNQNNNANKLNALSNQNANQKQQTKGMNSQNQNQLNTKGQTIGTQQQNNTLSQNRFSTLQNHNTINLTGNTTANNINITATSNSTNSTSITNNPNQNSLQQAASNEIILSNQTSTNQNEKLNNLEQEMISFSKHNSRQNTPSLPKQLNSGQTSSSTAAINMTDVNQGKQFQNIQENSYQSTPRQQSTKVCYNQSALKTNQQISSVIQTGSFVIPSAGSNSGNNINTSNYNQQLQVNQQNRQSQVNSPYFKDKKSAVNGTALQLGSQYQNSPSFLSQQQPQSQSQNKLDTMKQQYKKSVKDKKSIDLTYTQSNNINLMNESSMNNNFNPGNNSNSLCYGSSERSLGEKISPITATSTTSQSTLFNINHPRQKSARDEVAYQNTATSHIMFPLVSPTKNQQSSGKHRNHTEPNQITDFKDIYSPYKTNSIIEDKDIALQGANQYLQNSSSPLSTEPSPNPVPRVQISLGSMNQILQANLLSSNNNGKLQTPPKVEGSSEPMLNFSNDQSTDQEIIINQNILQNQTGKINSCLINLDIANIGTPEKNVSLHIKPGFYQQKGYQKISNRSVTPNMSGSTHKVMSTNSSNNTPKVYQNDNSNTQSNMKKALSNFNKFATAVYNTDEKGSKITQNNTGNNNNQMTGSSYSNNNNKKRAKLNNRLSQHSQIQHSSKDLTSPLQMQSKLSSSKINLNNNITNSTQSNTNFDPFKTADQILNYGSVCENEDELQQQNKSPKYSNNTTANQNFNSQFQTISNSKFNNQINLNLNIRSRQLQESNQSTTQSEKKGSADQNINNLSPIHNAIDQNNNEIKQNIPSHQFRSYDFSSQLQQNQRSSGSSISEQFASRNSQNYTLQENTSQKEIKYDEKVLQSNDTKFDLNEKSSITQLINNPIINLYRKDTINQNNSQIAQFNLNFSSNNNQQQNTQVGNIVSSMLSSPQQNGQNVFSQLYNLELSNNLQNQAQSNHVMFNLSGINQPINQNQMDNKLQNSITNSQSNSQIPTSVIPIDLKKNQLDFFSPQIKSQKYQFDTNNQAQQSQYSNPITSQFSISSAIQSNLQNKMSQKSIDYKNYQSNFINNYIQDEGNSSIEILNNYLNFCKFLSNLVRIINNSNFDKSYFSQSNYILEKVTFILLKNCLMKLRRLNEKMFGNGENIFNLNDWNTFKTAGKFTELKTSFFLLQTEIQSTFDQELNKGTLSQQFNSDYTFTQLFNKDMADDVRFYSISLSFIKSFITQLNTKLSSNYTSSLKNPTPIFTDKNDIVILILLDDFLEYQEILKTNLICMDSFHNQIFIKFNQFLSKCENTYNYLTLCSKEIDSVFISNIQKKAMDFGL